jgi:hypothetical protein
MPGPAAPCGGLAGSLQGVVAERLQQLGGRRALPHPALLDLADLSQLAQQLAQRLRGLSRLLVMTPRGGGTAALGARREWRAK